MFERIPEEMKQLPQWVCTNRGTKVPMMAEGNVAAGSNNPATWCDFRKAEEAVEKKHHDGVGFVFNNNGLVGIDIDKGYDEKGEITPEAFDIIHTIRSYTEKSRSGRGFHIIVKGDIPFRGRNNLGGVEMYKGGRYFIMTGQSLFYDKITENQSGLDAVVSKYFADSLKESRGGYSARVYNPEWSKPEDGKIKLRPKYPKIPSGSRNICLASLAGMLHTLGYRKEFILGELMYANGEACDPPLSEYEVMTIVNSITRYKR